MGQRKGLWPPQCEQGGGAAASEGKGPLGESGGVSCTLCQGKGGRRSEKTVGAPFVF